MYSRTEVKSCPVKASLFNFTIGFWVVFYLEHSKGNKTVPEKVATTRTEDGHK